MTLLYASLLPAQALASTLKVDGSGWYYLEATPPATFPSGLRGFTSPPPPAPARTAQFQQATGPSGIMTTSTDSGAILVEHFGANLEQTFAGSILVKARATAWNGILHASSSVSAVASPLAYGAGFVAGKNPYFAAGEGHVLAEFTDSILLDDPTLALGAPVSFRFGEIADVALSPRGARGDLGLDWSFTNFFSATGSFGTSSFNINSCTLGGRTCDLFSHLDISRTLTGVNGETVVLHGVLGAEALSVAGRYGDANGPANIESFDVFVDASNTARAFLDPITPTLRLVSESGHDYATGAASDEPSSVPEPGTLTLLAVGLGYLARRGRGLHQGAPC